MTACRRSRRRPGTTGACLCVAVAPRLADRRWCRRCRSEASADGAAACKVVMSCETRQLLTVGQRSWKIRFEAVLFSQGSEGHGREARVEWANGREAEVAGGYGGTAAAKGEGEMG
jgi:hypothetical protein